MLPIFQKAIPVIEKIEEAGFEAYFVGGAVRDWLMKRPIHDVDIATSATPAEMKQIFSHTVDVGIEHGTVVVIYDGTPYEITTFRTESEYKDFRRPDEVHFIRSLEADLERRDFTMNAIAMNKQGQLIDPFNGEKDILLGQIRTVGKAEERFSEDGLRMMRAVRFVSQLSFTLEASCFEALKNLGPILEFIAIERKTAEFEKILIGKNRVNGINLLYETNLYQFLPGLSERKQALLSISQYPINNLGVEEMWTLLIYCLQLDEKEIETFLRRWKLPIKKIRHIQSIYKWTVYRLIQVWDKESLYAAGKENIRHAEMLFHIISNHLKDDSIKKWLEIYENLPIKSRTEIKISGHDLIKMINRPSGPWIKEYLDQIEKAIIMGKLNNQSEEIREWVLGCNLK